MESEKTSFDHLDKRKIALMKLDNAFGHLKNAYLEAIHENRFLDGDNEKLQRQAARADAEKEVAWNITSAFFFVNLILTALLIIKW